MKNQANVELILNGSNVSVHTNQQGHAVVTLYGQPLVQPNGPALTEDFVETLREAGLGVMEIEALVEDVYTSAQRALTMMALRNAILRMRIEPHDE